MLLLVYLVCCVIQIPLLSEKNIFFEKENNYPLNVGIEIVGHSETIQSSFQKIDVYKTEHCGNMLVLDDAVQLTQWDNSAYHEMIAHVPLMNHPDPKRVLILGGGDGGALTEVIKHKNIAEIFLCEIDEQVIRVSQKYFPEFAQSFNDSRLKLVTQDGATYIKQYENYFDVIIIDASDPESPASVLYTDRFYQDIYAALTAEGIIVAQAESPFFHRNLIKKWHERNTHMFTHAHYYYALVPTYPSGVIGFVYCSKKYPYNNAQILHNLLPQDLSYYTQEIHEASFVLPKFLKDLLNT